MIESDDKIGKFEFRPLEPGYGITIGNALRRILLSSLTLKTIFWFANFVIISLSFKPLLMSEDVESTLIIIVEL